MVSGFFSHDAASLFEARSYHDKDMAQSCQEYGHIGIHLVGHILVGQSNVMVWSC